MAERARPRLIVVDDDAGLRTAIEQMGTSAGLEVQAFGSAEEFLTAIPKHDGPCCLILDQRMSGLSGLGLQQQLLRSGVHLPIIFLTGFADVRSAVQAMRAGAFDVLEKPFHPGMLLDRIKAALDLDADALIAVSENAEIATRLATLSPKERHVCDLLVQGKTSKEIARDLKIGLPTVAKHRAKVLRKCHVQNVIGLVSLIERCRRVNELRASGPAPWVPKTPSSPDTR